MKKATDRKILDSAQQRFWHYGHHASSLDKIANDAGQSKGALFHYFRNKKDITSQVLEKYASEKVFGMLERHFSQTPNTKEALLGWAMEIYQSYAQDEYRGGCLLGNLALELSDQDEVVRHEMARIFLDWENQLTRYFKDPARQGEIVMEPRQFARLLIATLQGITMTTKVHKDRNRAGREFQAFAELIERMVTG
ncbi:MAG: TetR/AcrR family transcriptional regulator [Rhodospirillales bacterium]|nr:TetR/AcrR family transcriptional regulator [Rhodospirillales bacterium]